MFESGEEEESEGISLWIREEMNQQRIVFEGKWEVLMMIGIFVGIEMGKKKSKR